MLPEEREGNWEVRVRTVSRKRELQRRLPYENGMYHRNKRGSREENELTVEHNSSG